MNNQLAKISCCFLNSKKQRFVAITCIYGFMWLLTAILGRRETDKLFDQNYRFGYDSMTSEKKVEIPRLNDFDVKDLNSKYNLGKIPKNGLFRYKSKGLTVTPFFIIDEYSVIYAPLGGSSGLRLNFWFFGYCHEWRIIRYWDV